MVGRWNIRSTAKLSLRGGVNLPPPPPCLHNKEVMMD